jgi:hypothetical protein
MENQNLSTQISKEHFHFGHFSFVFVVAVMLIGIAWLKDPAIFSVFHQTDKTAAHSDMPRYYAYVPPPEYLEPQVAGASTPSYDGPSIINEDGTISPAVDIGEVLGVSTEELNLSLNAIVVNTIPDNDEAVKKYLTEANAVEDNYMNSLEFETALTSNSQIQIDEQLEKIKLIIPELQKLNVPESLVNLHKNRILQYKAAVTILQNYTQADQNPEIVAQALGIFLQAQQQMENPSSLIQIPSGQ